MKYSEISKMSKNELQDKMKELELELIKLNGQVSTGTPPENPGKIKQLKRTVARMRTALQND